MTASPHSIRTYAALSLGGLYALLFYNVEIGLNLLLFDVLLLLAMLRMTPELSRHPGVQWASAGLLFSATTVVIVHSPAAQVAHHVSYLLLLGFAQARELRFVLYGLLLGIITSVRGPLEWIRSAKASAGDRVRRSIGADVLPYVVAGLIAIPFLVLYFSGNDRFGDVVTYLIDGLGTLHLENILFRVFLLGAFATILVLGLFFTRARESALVKHQLDFTDHLSPGQGNEFEIYPQPDVAPDRSPELKVGLATFVVLNVLLLVVNITDVSFVWLNTGELPAATLSHYVHESTYHLLCSICLAIVVVVYFFRGHLNWLGAGKIKWAATIWIGQNLLLLSSVGLRNYRYIEAYGLAIGRVYIAFVLFLLAFGLHTLYRKVHLKYTLTYLFQSNGMALWLTLLVFGAVNWPGVITRYNLATQDPEEVDWNYLYRGFDGRNDFLLAPLSPTKTVAPTQRTRYYDTYTDIRGWNYADYRNQKAYKQHGENYPIILR